MSRTPRISVIIPTYNRAALVANAIQSVLAQTYGDCEILVIDDGSTDGTADAVRPLEAIHPGRIRYQWQKNQGKSVALNHALRQVKSDFVAFLDSDDRWCPEKLEWQFQAIEKFGKDCPCFTDAVYTNNPSLTQTAFEFCGKHYSETIGLISDPTALFFGGRSGLYAQTMVLSKTMAEKVGNFDPQLRIGNDTDYLFRLGLLTSFCFVNKPLTEIDRTVNRKDGLIELIVSDEHLRIREREHLYNKWLSLTEQREGAFRQELLGCLAETHNDWANWHLVNRDYGKAREAMSKAVATQCTAKTVFKLALTTVAPPIARKEYLRRDSERAKKRVVT